MVVWNHGDKDIFIVTKYEPDPNGGHAYTKETMCIRPGQGIDLEVLGLKPTPCRSIIKKAPA